MWGITGVIDEEYIIILRSISTIENQFLNNVPRGYKDWSSYPMCIKQPSEGSQTEGQIYETMKSRGADNKLKKLENIHVR
jgi:hypothetical protein